MKVGIAGFGTIGKPVAAALQQGIDGLELTAICSRDREKAKRNMKGLCDPIPVVSPQDLADLCDVIVECVPKAAFRDIAEPALKAGRTLITVSGAGLLIHPNVVDIARENGAQIILATGALLGLDAVRAAAEGSIHDVTMITRKPPFSLIGAPYLEEHGISIENLDEPMKVFEGTAREGAAGFPANVNVAAALGMAGIGVDRTKLQIWADPALDRNTHRIEVEADSARFSLSIENVPSEENPGTGKITALSVIAALRGLTVPLKVGT
ncbi:MAG: aspartate dehydrogenase [Pseudomonadota bacterium]|nr:aspartate dehydrogenase [Pseudomonadota bacterium]